MGNGIDDRKLTNQKYEVDDKKGRTGEKHRRWSHNSEVNWSKEHKSEVKNKIKNKRYWNSEY